MPWTCLALDAAVGFLGGIMASITAKTAHAYAPEGMAGQMQALARSNADICEKILYSARNLNRAAAATVFARNRGSAARGI
jgi:hypothetical protein